MKTKINFPWVTILKEYSDYLSNNDDKCYICNISSIFAKLWVNKSYRLEIKEEMISFLKKFEVKYKLFRVDLDDRACCLVYCSIDDFESYEEKHRAEKNMKKHFLEYMVEKSKPKTKYSYFQHPKLFGEEGLPLLARRNNKTGEFHYVYYNYKQIVLIVSPEVCAQNVEDGIWIPANQKEINKIKRLYREPKYLYYRHSVKHCFGNPGSLYKHLMRYEPKTNDWFTYSYSDGIATERNNYYLWETCVKDGTWIPARKQEIKLAIKFNK